MKPSLRSIIFPIILSGVFNSGIMFTFNKTCQRFRSNGQRINFLHQLLVWTQWLCAHDDVAQLRVNLGIQTSITNQIDDPAFGFTWLHVQLIGQHADGDALMDATECFENHQASVLNELIQPNDNEKVIDDNRLAFVQLQARTFKIEIDVQMFEEFGDWIAIRV